MSEKNQNLSKNSNKNLSKNTVSESSMYIEEDVSIILKLSESKNRIFFITKISLLFTIYYFFAFLPIALITIFPKSAEKMNKIFRFEKLVFFFIFSKILLKTIFFFLQKKIEKYDKLFFLIDCKLIFLFVTSLYFYLENYLSKFYIHKGHYIFLITFTLLLNNLFFNFSTLIKKKAKIFKPLVSLILMSFSTLFSFYFVQKINKQIFLDYKGIFIFFLYFSFYNIYFCINCYFVTKFRAEFFYDNQFVFCFFNFFTDMFYVFWKDFVKSSYFYQKNISDTEIENKKNFAKKVLEKSNLSTNLVINTK